MTSILSFTGTRRGLTPQQRAALKSVLGRLHYDKFHHGDCVGADEQAASIAREMRPGALVIAHPPSNPALRAHALADSVLPERSYEERNRRLAGVAHALVACPDGPERLRSGTWQTVRFARARGIPIVVIYPDGTVARDRVEMTLGT